jgi:hypothetical protein
VPTSSRPKHIVWNNFLIKDDITRTEIIWDLNGVMCHSSLLDNEKFALLFAQIFPDSEIASPFAMHKDKNAYLVTFLLGPYFQAQLSSTVQKCDFFAIFLCASVMLLLSKVTAITLQ